jgi:hypothetical protein
VGRRYPWESIGREECGAVDEGIEMGEFGLGLSGESASK